jgi:transforming growth factor-beta-induced protein
MKKTVITLVAVFVFAFTAVFSPTPAPVAAAGGSSTIVEIALAVNAQTGEFSTLIAALSSAGLVDALNGRGQFTVFAPTDAAFAKLGLDATNIGSLPKADLTNILLYHVARGERLSGDVVSASRIRMMNGGFVFVSGTTLNSSSNIVAVDILASNGVIHIIDTVLLP